MSQEKDRDNSRERGNRNGDGGRDRGDARGDLPKDSRQSDEPTTSLLVRNLSYRVRADEIRRLMSRHGEVRDVYIPQDFYTKRPRGFCFCEFYNYRDASDALDNLDRYLIDGREMSIVFAKDRRKSADEMRPPGGNGGGRDSRDRGGDRGGGYGRDGDRDRGRGRDGGRDRGSRRSPSRSRSRDRRSDRRNRSRSPEKRRSRSPPRQRSASPAPRRGGSKSRSPGPAPGSA